MATSQQDLLLEGLWRYHVVKWTKDGGTWWGYPEIFMKRWPLLSFFSLLHIYVNLLFTTNACLIQINWTCQLTGQCQNIRLTWQAQTSQFSFDFPGECSSTQTKSFWVSTFSTDKINMPEIRTCNHNWIITYASVLLGLANMCFKAVWVLQ